jgi:pfkB family carbohydrate kinase
VVELTIGRRLLTVGPEPVRRLLVEVDGLRGGEIHRPAAVTVVPGGKGLNLARVTAELGAPVTAVGFVGCPARRWIETLGRYPVGSGDAFPVVPRSRPFEATTGAPSPWHAGRGGECACSPGKAA